MIQTMRHHKKQLRILVLFFLFMLLLAGAALWSFIRVQKMQRVENALYMIESETNKLQYAIDSRLLNTKILEMMVINNGGQISDFDSAAEMLFDEDPALRSLQLAPDGIVTYVYPLQGNEQAFMNLFEVPSMKVEAEWARDTGKMTLAGPFPLAQGGMGLVARNPIFLESSGQKQFWGFSTVVLNVPEIFDRANLDLLNDQSFYYRIWRIDPTTHSVQSIASNTEKELDQPIQGEIHAPNSTWFLSLSPKNGWVPLSELLREAAVALTIVFLSTLALAGILTVLTQKQELLYLTTVDALTGINNGRFFMTTLKDCVEHNKPFALFYIDLNKFKQINDHYGHDVGDELLKEVARRIKSCVSDADVAARIGGDEFTVTLLHNASEEECLQMKERLKEHVSQPFLLSGTPFTPQISVGYARCPEDGTGIEAIIRTADQRMYEEKRRSHL